MPWPTKPIQVEKTKFDVTTLHSQPKVAAQQRMVDDGSGQVDVFRVENNSLVQVSRNPLKKVLHTCQYCIGDYIVTDFTNGRRCEVYSAVPNLVY